MKHLARLMLALLCLPLLAACGAGEPVETAPATVRSFKMTATILAVGEKIEVNVTEGDYGASGPYWINTGDATKYVDRDGRTITRADLCVGDTVVIAYGGQVMMSYPPQIVATEIRKQ